MAVHYETDGPVAVTLDDVRREAQVSVGALYHHFADKAQLLDALYVELMSSFQEGFVECVRAQPTAEAGVRRGGFFNLDTAGTEGQSRRLILTDMDAWHWENLSLPAAGPESLLAPGAGQ